MISQDTHVFSVTLHIRNINNIIKKNKGHYILFFSEDIFYFLYMCRDLKTCVTCVNNNYNSIISSVNKLGSVLR